MMTTLKRYEPDLQYGGYGDAPAPIMSEYSDGDYVHHDDYQQLAAKLAEAEVERDRLREKNHELVSMGVELAFRRDEARQQLAATKADRDNWNNSLAKQTARVAVLESQLAELRERIATASDKAGRCYADKKAFDTSGMDPPELEAYRAYIKGMEQVLSVYRLIPAQPEPESSEATLEDRVKAYASSPQEIDAGEGWELCGWREAEQWRMRDGEQWHPMSKRDGFSSCHKVFRRRKVMPGNELPKGRLWLKYPNGRAVPGESHFDGVKPELCGGPIAWCHRLDGETEPPNILADWEGE